MANTSPEIMTGFPTPLSSATDPPPRSRWWTQLHSLFLRRKELTRKERDEIYGKPYFYSSFISATVWVILLFADELPCHVSFSVESISVSPSSATWHVDFLVKNPSPLKCPFYYDGVDVSAKLGFLNAAVLATSLTRRSRGRQSIFSVDLVTEGNRSDIVAVSHTVFQLDMKLSAKKKMFVLNSDEYGHYDIRCQNLMIGHGNIICHSSPFKGLKRCCKAIEL